MGFIVELSQQLWGKEEVPRKGVTPFLIEEDLALKRKAKGHTKAKVVLTTVCACLCWGLTGFHSIELMFGAFLLLGLVSAFLLFWYAACEDADTHFERFTWPNLNVRDQALKGVSQYLNSVHNQVSGVYPVGDRSENDVFP